VKFGLINGFNCREQRNVRGSC